MTMHLQQAIHPLQLFTLELQQEIQTALESNPLLEQANLHDEVGKHDAPDSESLDTREVIEQKDMPEELPLDATWDEMYSAGTLSGTGTGYYAEELLVYQGEIIQILQDHLKQRAELTSFSDIDKAIATSIVDDVDNTSYLTVPPDDIIVSISISIGAENVTLNEVKVVLKCIQHIQLFEPVGVPARDLRNYLLIQLSQFQADLPYFNEAQLIVSDYLNLLGNYDFRALLCSTKLKEEVLKPAMGLIQSLDPCPQQTINISEPHYIFPNALVRKLQNSQVVELNTNGADGYCPGSKYARVHDLACHH